MAVENPNRAALTSGQQASEDVLVSIIECAKLATIKWMTIVSACCTFRNASTSTFHNDSMAVARKRILVRDLIC